MNRVIEILNGKQVHPGSTIFSGENRAFRFGDGLFETIKIRRGNPLFIRDHLDRLSNGMELLKIEEPIDGFFDYLKLLISDNIIQEKIISGRIRLTVYRDSPGFYTPLDPYCGWHIAFHTNLDHDYITSDTGISLSLYSELKKDLSVISNVKTTSSLIYVLSGIFASEQNTDEALILNSEGRIIESSNSNIFIYKNDRFTTPPLTEGCVEGVLRRNLMLIMLKNGISVVEQPITKAELMVSDEILLCNVIRGVQWVGQFNGKTYKSKSADRFNKILNELTL